MDKFSSLSQTVGQQFPVGYVLRNTCSTLCSSSSIASCEHTERDALICMYGEDGAFWATERRPKRNVFFNNGVARRFGRKRLCNPVFDLDPNASRKACGDVPVIPRLKWVSQSNRYDEDLTTIHCAADTLPPRAVLNMTCRYETKVARFHWVHRKPNGKRRPIGKNLPKKCNLNHEFLYLF